MKINFDLPIIDLLEGKPFTQKGEVTTLKVACKQALLMMGQNENLTGEEGYERYKLAQKIDSGGIVELKSEEISKIKKLVGQRFSPGIIGPVYELLEGAFPVDAVPSSVKLSKR